MSQSNVLDAHVLLWFLEGNEKLSSECRSRLADPHARLLLPAIALAEACWAIGKSRSSVTLFELRAALSTDRRFEIVSLDGELVFAANSLPGSLEMHDRIIAATTARELASESSTVLLTADASLRSAKVVPTVW